MCVAGLIVGLGLLYFSATRVKTLSSCLRVSLLLLPDSRRSVGAQLARVTAADILIAAANVTCWVTVNLQAPCGGFILVPSNHEEFPRMTLKDFLLQIY